MSGITTSDWVVFGIAAYVAVTSLVRLMLARRNSLLAELQQQQEHEERLQRQAKKKAKTKQSSGDKAKTPARKPNAA